MITALLAVLNSKFKRLFYRPTPKELAAIRKETAVWEALSDEAWKHIDA